MKNYVAVMSMRQYTYDRERETTCSHIINLKSVEALSHHLVCVCTVCVIIDSCTQPFLICLSPMIHHHFLQMFLRQYFHCQPLFRISVLTMTSGCRHAAGRDVAKTGFIASDLEFLCEHNTLTIEILLLWHFCLILFSHSIIVQFSLHTQ